MCIEPRVTHHVCVKNTTGHTSHYPLLPPPPPPPHTRSNSSSLTPAVSVNVINYSSPGVGEDTIDPGVSPLTTGVREQEDIL